MVCGCCLLCERVSSRDPLLKGACAPRDHRAAAAAAAAGTQSVVMPWERVWEQTAGISETLSTYVLLSQLLQALDSVPSHGLAYMDRVIVDCVVGGNDQTVAAGSEMNYTLQVSSPFPHFGVLEP